MLALSPDSELSCALPLGDGAWTLLDAADYELHRRHEWKRSANGYAYRQEWADGTNHRVYLHREVLGLVRGDGLKGDHINRDRLDNRRCNLRLATSAEQMQNRTPQPGSSKHRGVYYRPKNPALPWRAGAQLNRKAYHLGFFATEQEAADAASAFRAKHMPFSEDARDAA